MKAIKYLAIVAMLVLSQIAASAQSTVYSSQLGPIITALKADPTNPNAAKDLVKTYVKQFKKNPEALVALGNAYFTAKQYDKAIMYADMALKKNKNFGDAYVLKGDVEALKDDGGEAAMWYQQSMTLDPTNPNGYTRYASIYRKRDPQTVEQTMELLKKNVPSYPADAELGHMFWSIDLRKAYEYYQRTNPSTIDESFLYEYAQAAYYLDKKEDAFNLSSIGVRRFAGEAYEEYFARYALYSAVDLDKMDQTAQFVQTLKNSKQDLVTKDYLYLGRVAASQGQYNEAIENYKKSLDLDGENILNYKYMSEAYKGLGDEAKALEFSERYISLDPKAAPSDFVNLATIYLNRAKAGTDKEADFSKAMSVYDKLADKYPTIASFAHLQQCKAGVDLEKTDYVETKGKQVIDELKDKADLKDSERGYLTEAYRIVGLAIWRDSKRGVEVARPYLEKLIQLDPENPVSVQAKKALGM